MSARFVELCRWVNQRLAGTRFLLVGVWREEEGGRLRLRGARVVRLGEDE